MPSFAFWDPHLHVSDSAPLVEELKACMTGFLFLAQPFRPQHSFVLSQFSSPAPVSLPSYFCVESIICFCHYQRLGKYTSAVNTTVFRSQFESHATLTLLQRMFLQFPPCLEVCAFKPAPWDPLLKGLDGSVAFFGSPWIILSSTKPNIQGKWFLSK